MRATLCLSMLLLATPVRADAPLPVAAFLIPGHIESASTGHFVELTQAVAQEARLPIEIDVFPPPRAIGNYLQGRHAMLFPALDVFFPPGKAFVRTRGSFNCKEDFVFTKKGAAFYTRLDALKGKRVGLTRGYPYVNELRARQDILFEEAATDEANVEKLMNGYIEAFVVEKESGTRAFRKMNALDKMQVQLASPVSRQDVYWAFQANAQGREWARQFDLALERLQKDKKAFARFNPSVITPRGCAR
jgi:polar amino acid transport system substrate-binding protein